MGARAWFAAVFDEDPKRVLARGPSADRAASLALTRRWLPKARLAELSDGYLNMLCPDDGQIVAADFGGLRIVAHDDFSIDHPSTTELSRLGAGEGTSTFVFATHSMADWCAFALWRDGRLVRALSLSPGRGVSEDVGEPLPFEAPFLDGRRDLTPIEGEPAYPFRFHPIELGQAAMAAVLGFALEGRSGDWVCRPSEMPVPRWRVL